MARTKYSRVTKSRKRIYAPRNVRTRGAKRVRVSAKKYLTIAPSTRNLTPFPNYRVTRHKYVETITMPSPSAGTMQYYTFSANGIYDPNITGTGHQPMWRDEMAAQYASYTVLDSSIQWHIVTESASEVCHLGAYVDDTAVSGQTRDTLIEQHGASNVMDISILHKPLVLRRRFSAKKWFKTTLKGLMSDDLQKVAYNSNPSTNHVYYHLWRHPLIASQTLDEFYMRVEVRYVVCWRDPSINAGS